MRFLRFMPLLLIVLTVLCSCDKSLDVNADWKDVTVVYGILDQTKDTSYIKVTKAFLGEGDAIQFAKIPDSSNYPSVLEVRLDAYDGETFKQSFPCDTVMIRNKKPYNDSTSFYYYPNQVMYFTTAKLNQDYTYKLYIRNKQTGNEVTSQTTLLHDFDVYYPQIAASFLSNKSFRVKWEPSKNGKRYQLVIRFFYQEALTTNPDSLYMKSFDWMVFSNVQPIDVNSTQPFDLYFPGSAFYAQVAANIPENSQVTRAAHHCDFIFTVGSVDLNTYMEVTEPSISLIQEKPDFTNIINGIGLFSSRFMKAVDSLPVSQVTKAELKVNPLTANLGF